MLITTFENYSELLFLFYRATHIPVSLYRDQEQLVSYVAVAISPDPAALYLKNAFSAEKRKETNLFYTSRHGIYCGLVLIKGTDFQIAVGPVSSVPPTAQQCSEILSDIGLPFSHKRELLYTLQKTPVLDFGRFLSLLKLLDLCINEVRDTPTDANEAEVNPPIERYEAESANVYHDTLELENNVLCAIRHGKTEELYRLLVNVPVSGAASGITAATPLRIIKNAFVTSAALASRAAIQVGLDYDYALSLTDFYVSKMEELKDEQEVAPLLGKMLLDLCSRVAELNKPKDCSPLTLAVLDDVNRHLRETLTVQDIAERLKKSSSYISHTFEKDMHLPLKQYILQKKIKEAQWMLAATKGRLSDIAARLGFSSQSHFQTVFKRVTDMTPDAYRQSVNGKLTDTL